VAAAEGLSAEDLGMLSCHKLSKADGDCMVCLEVFHASDQCRVLLSCEHRFGGWGGEGREGATVLQWGAHETRELITEHGGEIEREAAGTRCNAKTMWEAVVIIQSIMKNTTCIST
jgi:hypothetical protein